MRYNEILVENTFMPSLLWVTQLTPFNFQQTTTIPISEDAGTVCNCRQPFCYNSRVWWTDRQSGQYILCWYSHTIKNIKVKSKTLVAITLCWKCHYAKCSMNTENWHCGKCISVITGIPPATWQCARKSTSIQHQDQEDYQQQKIWWQKTVRCNGWKRRTWNISSYFVLNFFL